MFRRDAAILALILVASAPQLATEAHERVIGQQQITLPDGQIAWIVFVQEGSSRGFFFGQLPPTHRPGEVLLRIQDPSLYAFINIGSSDLSQHDLHSLQRFSNLTRLKLTGSTVSEEAVKELGALTALTDLNMSFAKVSDANLDGLGRLTNLRVLDLQVANIDDSAMRQVGMLGQLTSLNLAGVPLSDKGVAELGKLKNLTRLSLGGTASAITDVGVAALAPLGKLQQLSLAFTQVTGAIGPVLGGFSDLENLSLSHTQFDSAAMEHLAGLRRLKSLDLTDTKMDDAGLRHLAACKSLQSLSLRNTPITNEGLQALESLPELKKLDIRGTRTTNAGWSRLLDAPSLTAIEFDMALASARKSSQFIATETPDMPLSEDGDSKWFFRNVTMRMGHLIAEILLKDAKPPKSVKLIYPFKDHDIVCHAFSPDGKYVVLGGGTHPYRGINIGNISVWETATGELVYLRDGMGIVRKVAFTSDGRGILYAAEPCERDGL